MGARVLSVASALLFGVAMVGSTVFGFWLVPLVWLPAALILLAARHLLLGVGRRRIWLAILAAAILVCPILAFEGGFFVLPAAVFLLLADSLDGDPSRSRRFASGT